MMKEIRKEDPEIRSLPTLLAEREENSLNRTNALAFEKRFKNLERADHSIDAQLPTRCVKECEELLMSG